MTPDDTRHGTIAGAGAHQRAGIPICDACRRAKTRYQKRRILDLRHGKTKTLPAVGYIRRIQALSRIGWTRAHIAEAGGTTKGVLNELLSRPPVMVQRPTALAIERAYAALSGQQGPSERSRTLAALRGWPPPLAWDDIDDPKATPKGVRPETTCGTRSGYHVHLRAGETPCDDCRAANAQYSRERRAARAA